MTSKKMKILFIGTVDFSYRALDVLLENNKNIVGVITKKKSKFNSDFKDLTPLINQYNIDVLYKDEYGEKDLVNFIRNKKPDIIYCFGWSHILSSEILNIPSYGVIGFHPAELPNNRGRHPIIWALFLGLKQTASTFFFMDEGADTGDIISQEKVNISKFDTADSLYEKIINVGLKQILVFTKKLDKNNGNIDRVVQNKNEGNSWRKRGRIDGKIDFRMTTDAILNLVRALTKPYVGAHIEYKGEDVKVWKAEKESTKKTNYEPGKVLKIEGKSIVVKTYDAAIKITEHNFKEILKVGEYL